VALGLGRRVTPIARRWEDRWQPDLAAAEASVAAGARLLVVSDLHNPSGVPLGDGVLGALAAIAARGGAHVLVDEVYRYFDPAAATSRLAAPNVIAIGSLTKAFGLSWARAGWLIGPRAVASEAWRALLHVGPCAPAHAVLGCAALARLEALRARSLAFVADKRDVVDRWIAARDDVEWVLPARAPFGFPRFGFDTDALCRELLERDEVLLGPGVFFGAPRHVRLSWWIDRDRLDRALDRLGRALDASR